MKTPKKPIQKRSVDKPNTKKSIKELDIDHNISDDEHLDDDFSLPLDDFDSFDDSFDDDDDF